MPINKMKENYNTYSVKLNNKIESPQIFTSNTDDSSNLSNISSKSSLSFYDSLNINDHYFLWVSHGSLINPFNYYYKYKNDYAKQYFFFAKSYEALVVSEPESLINEKFFLNVITNPFEKIVSNRSNDFILPPLYFCVENTDNDYFKLVMGLYHYHNGRIVKILSWINLFNFMIGENYTKNNITMHDLEHKKPNKNITYSAIDEWIQNYVLQYNNIYQSQKIVNYDIGIFSCRAIDVTYFPQYNFRSPIIMKRKIKKEPKKAILLNQIEYNFIPLRFFPMIIPLQNNIQLKELTGQNLNIYQGHEFNLLNFYGFMDTTETLSRITCSKNNCSTSIFKFIDYINNDENRKYSVIRFSTSDFYKMIELILLPIISNSSDGWYVFFIKMYEYDYNIDGKENEIGRFISIYFEKINNQISIHLIDLFNNKNIIISFNNADYHKYMTLNYLNYKFFDIIFLIDQFSYDIGYFSHYFNIHSRIRFRPEYISFGGTKEQEPHKNTIEKKYTKPLLEYIEEIIKLENKSRIKNNEQKENIIKNIDLIKYDNNFYEYKTEKPVDWNNTKKKIKIQVVIQRKNGKPFIRQSQCNNGNCSKQRPHSTKKRLNSTKKRPNSTKKRPTTNNNTTVLLQKNKNRTTKKYGNNLKDKNKELENINNILKILLNEKISQIENKKPIKNVSNKNIIIKNKKKNVKFDDTNVLVSSIFKNKMPFEQKNIVSQ